MVFWEQVRKKFNETIFCAEFNEEHFFWKVFFLELIFSQIYVWETDFGGRSAPLRMLRFEYTFSTLISDVIRPLCQNSLLQQCFINLIFY